MKYFVCSVMLVGIFLIAYSQVGAQATSGYTVKRERATISGIPASYQKRLFINGHNPTGGVPSLVPGYNTNVWRYTYGGNINFATVLKSVQNMRPAGSTLQSHLKHILINGVLVSNSVISGTTIFQENMVAQPGDIVQFEFVGGSNSKHAIYWYEIPREEF